MHSSVRTTTTHRVLLSVAIIALLALNTAIGLAAAPAREPANSYARPNDRSIGTGTAEVTLGETGVWLIRETDREIVVASVVAPDDIAFDTRSVADRTYATVALDGYRPTTTAGAPQLPARTVSVAVPAKADIDWHIEASEERNYECNPVLPAPAISYETDFGGIAHPEKQYLPNTTIYGNSARYPAATVRELGESAIRNTRVAQFELLPVRANLVDGGVNVQTYLELHITFSYLHPSDRPDRIVSDSAESTDVTPRLAASPAVRDAQRALHNVLVNPSHPQHWHLDDRSATETTRTRTIAPDPDPDLSVSRQMYKLTVETTGMHRLTYADLLGAGVNPGTIDPRTIKIYNNGAEMLPFTMDAPDLPAPLEEVAILVTGEADGRFDPTDAIVFYGESPDRWDLSDNTYRQNYNTDRNIYWLTWGDDRGRRMATQNGSVVPDAHSHQPVSFIDRIHFEEDNHQYVEAYTQDPRNVYFWEIVQASAAPWTNGYGVVKTAGSSAWSDYTLTLSAKRYEGAKGFIIMFRVDGANSFYLLELGGSGNTTHRLIKATPSSPRTVLASVATTPSTTIETDQWHQITIRLDGARIRCSLDDTALFDHTDTSQPYLNGGIGLNADYAMVVGYDDITVTARNAIVRPAMDDPKSDGVDPEQRIQPGTLFSEHFERYPPRSNGTPVWRTLQGTIGDLTVRPDEADPSDHVYRSCTETLKVPFTLRGVRYDRDAQIDVRLQGAKAYNENDHRHHSAVYLNGHLIEDAIWNGNYIHDITQTINSSWLQPGTNILELDAPGNGGDNWDYIYLDHFEVRYPRAFRAHRDRLAFDQTLLPAPENVTYTVHGFQNVGICVFNTTEPAAVKHIVNTTVAYDHLIAELEAVEANLTPTTRSSPYRPFLRFKVSFSTHPAAGVPERFETVTARGMKTPTIAKNRPSSLRATTNHADYLIITGSEFIDAIRPLAAHRARDGMTVRTVRIDDIYDEFHHGITDPVAIRDFVYYAYHYWRQPAPSYILLVGDVEYVPPIYSSSHPTDMYYSCTTNDSAGTIDPLPDIMIGRFSANTVEEVSTLAEKTINYESATPSGEWRREVLLTCGLESHQQGWLGDDFDNLRDQLLHPVGANVTEIYRSIIGYQAAHEANLANFNAGRALVTYCGHGGITSWQTMSVDDLPQLTNTRKLPFILSLACNTGWYDHRGATGASSDEDSMSEAFVKWPDGGAIAFMGASRWSTASDFGRIDRIFYEQLCEEGTRTLGAAILQLKIEHHSSWKNSLYNLMGDPALKLRFADEGLDIETNAPVGAGARLTVRGTADDALDGIATFDITYPNQEVRTVEGVTVTRGYFSFSIAVPDNMIAGYGSIRGYAWNRGLAALIGASEFAVGVPAVELLSPDSGQILSGEKYIYWTASDPDGDPLSFNISYSDDGGMHWVTLATGLSQCRYLWDTTTLADGADYFLRVEVSDGSFRDVDQCDSAFIIDNPPPATITTLADGSSEKTMTLRRETTTTTDDALPQCSDSGRWRVRTTLAIPTATTPSTATLDLNGLSYFQPATPTLGEERGTRTALASTPPASVCRYYPSDVRIDIGGDGRIEYRYEKGTATGRCVISATAENETRYLKTPNARYLLTGAVGGMRDGYHYTVVGAPVRSPIPSRAALRVGSYELSDGAHDHDFRYLPFKHPETVPDFSDALQQYMRLHERDAHRPAFSTGDSFKSAFDAEADVDIDVDAAVVEVPIVISSLTPGRVRVSNINIQIIPDGTLPTVSWVATSGYRTDGVSPDVGDPTQIFEYRISYTNLYNVAPAAGSPQVWIDLNGDGDHNDIDDGIAEGAFAMTAVDPADTYYPDGRVYSYETQLPVTGNARYRFSAMDAAGRVAVAHPGPIGGLEGPLVFEIDLEIRWQSAAVNESNAVAWGDVDGDGDPDLAIGNSDRNALYTNLGGTFLTPATWRSNDSAFTTALAWCDIDGDGDLDLVAGNSGRNGAKNVAYRNNGGALDPIPAWESNITDRTTSILCADINGDGADDIVVGNDGPNHVYYNTAGTFALDPDWSSFFSGDTTSLACADVDGDGDLDVAAGNDGEQNTVYFNTGTELQRMPGWFSQDTQYTQSVAFGDVDGDGWVELAAGNRRGPSGYYPNHNGTLGATYAWTTSGTDYTNSISFADLDGDGASDLVCGNSGRNTVYYNYQGLLIENPIWVSSDHIVTTELATADVDGDGDLDLAAANGGGMTVPGGTGNFSRPDGREVGYGARNVLYRNN